MFWQVVDNVLAPAALLAAVAAFAYLFFWF
jgi:hypothetical protein